MHVIVIGGGFAGLTAATQLAEEQHQVTLLERRAHLGGRAFPAETEPTDGQGPVLREPPPRPFFGYFRAARHFLDRIGTAGKLHFPPRLELVFVDRRARRPRERTLRSLTSLPSPLDRLGALAGFGGLSLVERGLTLRVVAALTAPSRLAPGPQEGDTVESWLRALSQSERACEGLWYPLALLVLQDDPRRAAAAPFALALRSMFLGPPDSACLALPATDAQQLYVDDARRYLETHGGTLRTGTAVRALQVRERRPRLILEGVEMETGEVLQADAVIAAIPPAALVELLPAGVRGSDPYFQALGRLQGAPAVTVHLRLDRPLEDVRAAAVFAGSPFHWLAQRHDGTGRGSEVWLQAFGAWALSDREDAALVRLATDELRAAFPEAQAARVLAARVLRERDAFIGHPAAAGGESLRPKMRTPVEGLFVAGDYARTGLPANLESAARSAGEAAALALEYEPPPPPAPPEGFIPANRLVRRPSDTH
ncbi:MAG TPA: FAD-dependent oxidoreductase [Polyangia bacterium]|nr:FAD-dependent oxidoreductase [Polyangia bacterium]